jgi:type VI secretion system secreted protein Hcp
MKRNLIPAILILLISAFNTNAQKIMMKIPSVTDKAGEEVRTLEFNIEATSSWTKGGGASVGKPGPQKLTIHKMNNKTTTEFFKHIVTGHSFPEISFEYYDQGQKLIYTMTVGAAYITEVSWSTPECNNCPKLEMKMSMVFKTFETNDVLNGIKTKWDIPSGVVQ